MKNYFKLKEFFKQALTRAIMLSFVLRVVDIIDEFIRPQLNKIRGLLGVPIYVLSCYRPKFWEYFKGRSGKSQHTFDDKGVGVPTGAVDLSTRPEKMNELIRLLIEHSTFTRICYYPQNGFIHVDFRKPSKGSRAYYEMQYNTKGKQTGWKLKKVLAS